MTHLFGFYGISDSEIVLSSGVVIRYAQSIWGWVGGNLFGSRG